MYSVPQTQDTRHIIGAPELYTKKYYDAIHGYIELEQL